jgi:hypothetical protein
MWFIRIETGCATTYGKAIHFGTGTHGTYDRFDRRERPAGSLSDNATNRETRDALCWELETEKGQKLSPEGKGS